MSDHTTLIITNMRPGDMERIILPEFGDNTRYLPGRIGKDGLNIAVGRYEQEHGGGLYVSINTEDMDTDHIDGEPQMTVMLNDGELYEAGERIVRLSDEAYAVLCGLVQPSDVEADIETGVNQAGIFTGAWDELRKTFPRRRFIEYFEGRDPEGGTYYDPDAGM